MMKTAQHEQYMLRAIELARQNPRAPFAALLVDVRSRQVMAEGLNRSDQNPTWHAEIDVINQYARTGDRDWHGLRLYTTAEPCCMCQGAIMWAGIGEVVFGTRLTMLQSLGWPQIDLRAADIVVRTPFARCELLGGVLSEQCDQLFINALK
jgi:tRNA(Arg) A34 adenosine deaminase TadA